METLQAVVENLRKATQRTIEWQILSKHPELWSDEGITWLKKERVKAWEKKDYKRIQNLSSRILMFELCRDAGPEIAFFGRDLDEEQRKALGVVVSWEVVEAARRIQEVFPGERHALSGREATVDSLIKLTFGAFRSRLQKVVNAFLDCGLVENGFARVRCPGCAHELLVPYSCKCKLCPSCTEKRVLLWAERIAEEVLLPFGHRSLTWTI